MIRRFFGLVLVVKATTIIIVTRLSNPDMTEMRLLIEFWPGWLVVLGMLLVSAVLLGERKP